ncbi:MAG: hypothetical protein KAJ19_15615 [Gammaproteobacteria bacterium]|nr:hypothetical protein [Gammaproteobacteria bacterium]
MENSLKKRKIKIIRVGSTPYSGSTMIDLMLSNADDAFSCGEVHALFRPFRPHHFDPRCICSDPGCTLWKKVKAHGETELWNTLTTLLPNVEVFVDSSKNLVWFMDQMADKGCDFKPLNVLVWKTPGEYAYSCMKRGRLKSWKRGYISYHIRYFSVMPSWFSVRYSELARDPAHKLQRLCECLEIPYFPGKEHYWNRQYHTLFGSYSAKLHLYNRNTSDFANIVSSRSIYKSMVDTNTEPEVQYHKTIYYEEDVVEKLPPEIRKELEEDPVLNKIRQLLELTEVGISGARTTEDIRGFVQGLKQPVRGWYMAQKVKRYVQFLKCKLSKMNQ